MSNTGIMFCIIVVTVAERGKVGTDVKVEVYVNVVFKMKLCISC
jgi:hypothetical protein